MMGGVFPRQGGERGFLLQILHFLCGKTLATKQESAFFPDLVVMKVKLPRAVPPKMGFNLHGLPEWVGAGEVIFFDGKGVGLLATVQGAIRHMGREGGVDGVRSVGKLDIEADAGAEGEFAPFVGAEDGVGFGDGGAGIEEFDFASDTTNHQIGFGKWF